MISNLKKNNKTQKFFQNKIGNLELEREDVNYQYKECEGRYC